ncbi:hypothetical protein P8452_51126 [Trifolium repens]|nr:hypothetical protein P8452_51126 [Trifolium repens]
MESISSVLMGGSSFFDMAQGWVMGVGWVGDGGAVFLLRWWFLSSFGWVLVLVRVMRCCVEVVVAVGDEVVKWR